MISRSFVCFVAAVAAALVAGCATNATSIDARWASPSLATREKPRSVLVVAALRDATQRRILEDRMVEALGGAGVRATPSHRLLADSAQVTESALRTAAAGADASHVLVSSISGVSTEVRVTPGMVMGPGWGPGRGWNTPMGPAWGGMANYHSMAWGRSIPPDVRTTQNLHGDTRLFDVKSSEVVWSAATTTATGWDSVPAMIEQFARLIVDNLKSDAVI
jgi:hypothetical protein